MCVCVYVWLLDMHMNTVNKFFSKQQEKGTKRREQKKGIMNMATPHGHHQRKKSFLPCLLSSFLIRLVPRLQPSFYNQDMMWAT